MQIRHGLEVTLTPGDRMCIERHLHG
jgi:hypothetical protein